MGSSDLVAFLSGIGWNFAALSAAFRHLSACLAQPLRLVGKQCLDLFGGERLVHIVALESSDGDAKLLGNHGTRVRTVVAQILQPLWWIVLECVELLVGYGVVLELLWRCWQKDAELLCGGLGLHCGARRLDYRFFIHAYHGSITYMLALSFITGTEPDKWFFRFRERTNHGQLVDSPSDDPVALVLEDEADLALTRLPDERVTSSDNLHVVELYEEAPGIALNKDNEITIVDPVGPTDIEGEIVNYCIAADGSIDYDALRTAMSVVGANVGVAIAPRPLLKVLAKKEVSHRGFSGDVPGTRIALVWKKDKDSDAIQDFVGIAKGRTANSSRQEKPKLTASQKAKAKQERRAKAAGKTTEKNRKIKSNKRETKALPKGKKSSSQRKRRK